MYTPYTYPRRFASRARDSRSPVESYHARHGGPGSRG
jgi:hypothetical protein